MSGYGVFMVDESKYIGGPIPSELKDKIDAQVEECGWKIGRVVIGMAKLWAELPPSIQARLLSQSLESDSFIELVQQIVDERIEEGRKAAQALVGRQKRKPGRKDRPS